MNLLRVDVDCLSTGEPGFPLDPALATRKALHRPLPCGYGSRLCRIAGMRMPRKVILDV